MSLIRERKPFKISITIFVYASYVYTSGLMGRVVSYIKRSVSQSKLVDMIYRFEEL